jgi:hypothetical protein
MVGLMYSHYTIGVDELCFRLGSELLIAVGQIGRV